MPPALHSELAWEAVREQEEGADSPGSLLARGGGEVRALFALSRDAIRKDRSFCDLLSEPASVYWNGNRLRVGRDVDSATWLPNRFLITY